MDKHLRIAVVSGGFGPEAEVSRSSGKEVVKALASYHSVTPMEFDRDIVSKLQNQRVDIVFPVLHGSPGEDGTFQAVLEMLSLPYVGSGVLASAVAMNKIFTKHVVRSVRLSVSEDFLVGPDDDIATAVENIFSSLGDNVVIKPASQGSSIGVIFGRSRDEIHAALIKATAYGGDVLVEKRVKGKEVTVAVLERNGVEVLPVIEIVTPNSTWYDYEHRYTPGLSEHIIPANISDSQYKRVQEMAKLAHETIGCRDFSRSDFIVPEDGEPIFLETNTIPGMTTTSLFPDAARAAGISFEELMLHLVRRAWSRASQH